MCDGLRDWIEQQLHLGVNKQGKIAHAELLACGVPVEAFQKQWQLQQAAQLSVRSRECISLLQHMHNLI
jgi:hypothetical protein